MNWKIPLIVTLLLFASPCLADNAVGSIGRTYFDCDPYYKLWNILWFGVTGHPRSLENSPTNLGPWTTQISSISGPTGELSPATNLKWYRARHRLQGVNDDHDGSGTGTRHLLGADHFTSICWVPNQRCRGGIRPH